MLINKILMPIWMHLAPTLSETAHFFGNFVRLGIITTKKPKFHEVSWLEDFLLSCWCLAYFHGAKLPGSICIHRTGAPCWTCREKRRAGCCPCAWEKNSGGSCIEPNIGGDFKMRLLFLVDVFFWMNHEKEDIWSVEKHLPIIWGL